MSTNMTGFRWFSKIFAFFCALDEGSALEGLRAIKALLQVQGGSLEFSS